MSSNEKILDDGEIVESPDVLGILAKAETDIQIATAKQYPRSLKDFKHEATEMVTLDEEIAGECMYALKRSGKVIEGPSARFAEIAASAWGNCRAGARVIDVGDKFVTAQGVFADLQRNVIIQYEVQRRITDRSGRRYGDDMIGVTSNAACSIALRNAILKGIPKAFWKGVYASARQAAIGNAETLSAKRGSMLTAFGKMGADNDAICAFLEVKGVEDITLDHLALLRGVYTSVKDGEISIDTALDTGKPAPGKKVSKSRLNEKAEQKPKGGVIESINAELPKCETPLDVQAARDLTLDQCTTEDEKEYVTHAAAERIKELTK